MRRYEISEKRQRAFDRRDDEDVHAWIARQINMARPYETTWLFMIRDDTQRQAIAATQSARAAYWSRWAVIAVVLSIPANVAIVLLAR